jgi:type IV secretion system protein VirB5
VVQVDKIGQAQAVAPANADYQPSDPQIAYHLARFIEDVRGLPADGIVLRRQWLRAYEYTTDHGAAALNDYAPTNDPFANLTIVIQTPHDADRLRKNPLGVYVNAINWSKELGQ